MWDFDPAETITEKLSSISNVKGMRGFRRLLKEITATAINQANLNELIGRCEILLTVSFANIFLLILNVILLLFNLNVSRFRHLVRRYGAH